MGNGNILVPLDRVEDVEKKLKDVENSVDELNSDMADFANLLYGTEMTKNIESNSSANPTILSQIKFPKDGLYLVFGYIQYQANGNGYRGLYMSGGQYKIIPAASGITTGMTAVGVLSCKANDYASLLGLQNSGSVLTCESQFRAVRIG